MARLNIEDEFFLAVMGMVSSTVDVDRAHGNVLRFIRLAQEKFKRHTVITDLEFERLGFLPAMVGIFAERVDGGYRAIGDHKYFSWLLDSSERGSLGGQKSAEVRKERYGSSQPRSNSEANSKQPEAAEPSPSPSSSLSPSISVNTEIHSAVVKPTRRKQSLFKPQSIEELRAAFDEETRKAWAELYPDADYRKRESLKCWEWYRDAGSKRPTTLAGWKRAMRGWFERGWAGHAKSLPHPGAKNASPSDRWDSLAGTVLAAIKKFPPGDPGIGSFIGADWEWISRSGIMSSARSIESNDFGRKRLVKELKDAFERVQARTAGAS